MSPREAIQKELSSFLIQLGLDESYGVIEAECKRFRSVTFAKNAILDGVVEIYGPKFILVKWRTAIRRLPHQGQEKFESVEATKEFINENFGV